MCNILPHYFDIFHLGPTHLTWYIFLIAYGYLVVKRKVLPFINNLGDTVSQIIYIVKKCQSARQSQGTRLYTPFLTLLPSE